MEDFYTVNTVYINRDRHDLSFFLLAVLSTSIWPFLSCWSTTCVALPLSISLFSSCQPFLVITLLLTWHKSSFSWGRKMNEKREGWKVLKWSEWSYCVSNNVWELPTCSFWNKGKKDPLLMWIITFLCAVYSRRWLIDLCCTGIY